MKCEILLDGSHEERVVIYARQIDRLVTDIQRLVEESSLNLIGYQGTEIVPLELSEIHCFTVINGKIYALDKTGKWQLKQRLYQLEEKLPDNFIKINQSCIANVHNIERFDASVSGTLKLRFKNGHTDYVSRRQLKSIKERLGI